MNREDVTGDLVREWFVYDPESGTLTWRKMRKGSAPAGRRAGRKRCDGYLSCLFFGKPWMVHRLIWLYLHDHPGEEIDHINGTRDDNRICNIRSVSRGVNARNTAKHRAGKLVGAYYRKKYGNWASGIWWNKKYTTLGYFATAQEAHAAWRAAREERMAKEQMQEVA